MSGRISWVGLLATWRTADPIARRELLLALFDKLHVDAGQIVAYTPREDRMAEVIELIETATAKRARSGAGGV